MIAPLALADRLAASRAMGVQKAIVTTLKPLFPGVAVRRHPGRMDLADFVEQDLYKAPTIAVAVTRVRAARHLEGTFAVPVEWAAYLIVEDMVVGDRRVERDEIGHAIGFGLLDVLNDPVAPRWGLGDITDPLDEPQPELRPLFTAATFARGAALYAVSWHQGLIQAGEPLWDFTSPPDPTFAPAAVLPGDPGYDEGAP